MAEEGGGGEAPGGDASPNDDGRATPTEGEVVDAASEAAEAVVFSRYRRSDVRDVDVAVTYEDGLLEVDVYLNVPDADDDEHVDDEVEQVADDAARAAVDAVDRLFAERGE